MRIIPEDTAAIIIDFQEKVAAVMDSREELLRSAGILIKGLAALDIPMLMIEQYKKGLGPTVDEILEVIPAGTPAFEKMTFSCCGDDAIVGQLRCLGRKNIIVCGIEAHICVLQTVTDLAAAGFVPVVVADCTSSRKVSDKAYAIERARAEGAVVTTYEAILFELARRAGTEQFKTISKLVK